MNSYQDVTGPEYRRLGAPVPAGVRAADSAGVPALLQAGGAGVLGRAQGRDSVVDVRQDGACFTAKGNVRGCSG